MTVVAVVDSEIAAAVAAVAVETAVDSVETVADSAEVAVVSAPLVVKCSTRCAPNVVRKRKFPSSPAVLAPFIAEIASRLTARHVVAAVVAVADSATAAVAAIAVPAVTNPQAIL